jgi:hypothetical protein
MDKVELTEQQKKARRSRSVALGCCAGCAGAVLFYVVTIVKIGPDLRTGPM